MSEHDEQCLLFDWARALEDRHPQLALLCASANGGLRHKAVAAKLKKSGVKAGFPDISLLVPMQRTVYGFSEGWIHGLFIELKVGKNKPTKLQKEWIERLNDEGYRAEVCYGFEEARDVIVDYLRLETR